MSSTPGPINPIFLDRLVAAAILHTPVALQAYQDLMLMLGNVYAPPVDQPLMTYAQLWQVWVGAHALPTYTQLA